MMLLVVSLASLIVGSACLYHQQSFQRALLISAAILVNLVLLGFFILASNLSGHGIDESVLYHIVVGVAGAGFEQFGAEIIFSLIWVVLSFIIAFSVCKSVIQSHRSRSLPKSLFGVLALIAATILNPTLVGVLRLADPVSDKTRPQGYVSQPSIGLFSDKKNVVYIYLESLERGYLDEQTFPGLVPNLKKLESEALSFSQISQPTGASWTIAGMVASQCGTPLIVSGEQNSMSGIDDFLPSVHCVGDELAQQDYQLTFMGGARLDFGGKGDFYRSHSFQKVLGFEALQPHLADPSYVSGWGLYDDSLFDLARDEIVTLSASEQPFGLFLLTLDTHQPHGYVNQQCGELQYGDGSVAILNAIHCADRLISDFVTDIQAVDTANETIVIIASDHLAMPGEATDVLKKKPRRNLWLVLGEDIDAGEVSVAGTTFDLAPTLLALLGAESAAMGFGRNLWKGGRDEEPQSERNTITTLNETISQHRAYFNSLWEFPQINQGVIADMDNMRLGTIDDRYIEFPSVILLDKDLAVEDVLFSRYGRQTLLYRLRGLEPNQRFFWLDECRFMTWLEKDAFSEGQINNPSNDQPAVCWAYGHLGADVIEVDMLENGMRLEARKIQSQFESAISKRSSMWARLQVLSDQIAAKELPVN